MRLEKPMRRTSVMTMGFVLIFIGIQFNLVETYVLTPRFSSFLSEHASPVQPQGFVNGLVNPNSGIVDPSIAQNSIQNSPFYQASYPGSQPVNIAMNGPINRTVPNYAAPKVVTPPNWLCWPILFLGTVVFLHGFSMRRD